MSEGPSLDEFRRWLQEELVMADSIRSPSLRENRRWELEAALQEATIFDESVKRRNAAELPLYEEAAAVRLLSTPSEATERDTKPSAEYACTECDEPMDAELEFCPSCGQFR